MVRVPRNLRMVFDMRVILPLVVPRDEVFCILERADTMKVSSM